MIRIGLVYFDVNNLGDLVIYETARYLVEKILGKHKIDDYELVPIDIGSKNQRQYRMGALHRLSAKLASEKLHRVDFVSQEAEQRKALYIDAWRKSKTYLWFAKWELPKFQNLDFVIFCGGGIIKYHQQNFHYFLHEITDICDKKHIPVIINSTGVEGYDALNLECQILKTAINRDCVKYISTRDDLKTLTSGYIENPNIKAEGVCDPALWTRECYRISAEEGSRTVGLGVIRPEIFKDYMYYVNQEFLADMYFALAKSLCEEGYQVEFFCNGLDKDAAYIKMIMNRYPSLQEKYHVKASVPETTRELVETIARYDRILAVRLHASIIATTLGVPNLNLVWNTKQILFGEQIGLAENYITKEQFDDRILFDRLINLKKPKIKEEYKNSVLTGLESAILNVLKDKEYVNENTDGFAS